MLEPTSPSSRPNHDESNNRSTPISYRRHSSPFPLRFAGVDFQSQVEQSANSSSLLHRRTSVEENATPSFLEPSVNGNGFGNMKRQPASIRRSERAKRRKSIDQDDPYVMEEDDEDEEEDDFVPKTPPRAERPRPRKTKKKPKFECSGKDKCALCQNGAPYYLHKSMNPGWRETLLAVFEFFPKRVTVRQWRREHNQLDESEEAEMCDSAEEVEWLYLPDAYGFLEYHWEILCPPQHRNRTCTNWRKTLQDTLSHNRTYFISGKELFGRTGFWRLYERAPSPSHHCNDERARFLSHEGMPTLFSTPITVDSFFRIPEVPPAIKSGPSSLMASADVVNDNHLNVHVKPERKQPTDFSELQLLLEAIDCVQRT